MKNTIRFIGIFTLLLFFDWYKTTTNKEKSGEEKTVKSGQKIDLSAQEVYEKDDTYFKFFILVSEKHDL